MPGAQGRSVELSPAVGLGLGSRTSVLAERALVLLGLGPADAVSVVREVCQIPSVAPALADHLAAAMLGGDSRFARRVDGSWELARPTVQTPTDLALDA